MGMEDNSIAFTLKTQTGAFDIEASVRRIGQDFVICIWGGETPHVGAVAVAQPRPSLKDSRNTSATASVFCVLGHKEDEMAKAVSEILSAVLNARVVVTAGIHWDNLSPEGISRVIQNSEILVEMILKRIAGMKSRNRQKQLRQEEKKG
ncbi:MAG: hypothetical protein JRI83_08765 [Deltaproteobacteria bacterium]|nr:hypothetical protein [Deltaproteobacteria bacterium]